MPERGGLRASVECVREFGGGERQRVERDAGLAQPHRGERRDRQPDAECEQILGALAQHLPCRSVDHDVAVGVEHDDPVDDVDRRVEVVLDEHDAWSRSLASSRSTA